MKIQLMALMAGHKVPVNLEYKKSDPYAVGMTIVSTKPVTWVIGRDLLRDGLTSHVGEMDVNVQSGEKLTYVFLSSPSGAATFVFRKDDIVEFLRSTEVMVPFGREVIDWSKAAAVFPGVDLDTVATQDGAS